MLKINAQLLIRFALVVVLLVHSITGIFNNGINDFGNLYLNQVGFAPLGLPIAWAIKLSHIASATCLIINKFIKWAVFITIFILVCGIVMIHFQEGWFVVGGGRNGMEFNFVLIFMLLSLLFPKHNKETIAST